MTKKVDFLAEFKKQQAKGIDIVDPMNNLITKQEPKETNVNKTKKPFPQKRRVQILMTEELYDNARAIADENGISFSNLISLLCSKAVRKRKAHNIKK